MNIDKIKSFFKKSGAVIDKGLEKRIDNNELTPDDIKFIEKCMNMTVLSGLSVDLNLLVPTFIEGSMRLQELKNEGETEVDLDYTLNLVNDMTNFFVELREKLFDIGLEFSFIDEEGELDGNQL